MNAFDEWYDKTFPEGCAARDLPYHTKHTREAWEACEARAAASPLPPLEELRDVAEAIIAYDEGERPGWPIHNIAEKAREALAAPAAASPLPPLPDALGAFRRWLEREMKDYKVFADNGEAGAEANAALLFRVYAKLDSLAAPEVPCPKCKGARRVKVSSHLRTYWSPCLSCHGTGRATQGEQPTEQGEPR